MANGSTTPLLSNAARRIPKATYVPLSVPADDSDGGRAVLKFGFVRQLSLQPGEVDAVQGQLSTSTNTNLPWDILRQFEGQPMPSQLPSPSVFTRISSAALVAFGRAIVAVRQKSAQQLQQQASKSISPSATGAATTLAVKGPGTNIVRPSSVELATVGKGLNLTNIGLVATNAFEANVAATPIGMLNLERLEMTPAGVERGELLATIPLAPKEQTAVVQKEWSVTTKEFTSIVTDSLENYSETGVTENTDLSQSITSQTQHSNQFNINATVSGGTGFVSGSVSTGFTSQDSSSQSASDSRKHAVQTTRKASARVKQEHKMTISTTTVTGTSETSTRILQNSSDTDPMRIDYFSLMRKWHIGLYRYGLRLTYDIAIPEPSGTLREAYMVLADLQVKAAQGFTFPLQYSDITPPAFADPSSNLWFFANQWGAQITPPSTAALVQILGGPIPNLPGDGKDDWVMNQITFTIPDGYAISDVTLEVMLSNTGDTRPFYVFGSGQKEDLAGGQINATYDLTQFNNFMAGLTGNQVITYFVTNCGAGSAVFTITQQLTTQAQEQWAASVWSALYNAAQTVFYAQQQAVNSQIQALQDKINNVDTLTLRREENDEIMKGVLRWLLGPAFDFMPQDVISLFGMSDSSPDGCPRIYSPTKCDLLTHGVSFTGNDLFTGDPTLWPSNWSTMFLYQEMVKFINEAIEWENVLYFLYSYFWDVPASWDFIREIQHPDAIRQAFLRAGSARVVLTVRKGWETAWINFVEAGGFGQTLLPNHPYMSIAQEIQAYDDTNYPGIPSANPGGTAPPDDGQYVGTTSSSSVKPGGKPIELAVASAEGFNAGNTVIIDTWDMDAFQYDPTKKSYTQGVQETQMIVAVDTKNNTITVQGLRNAHDGSVTPFPVVQSGEKGVLIAEWFEYTPTSGTDIAVTSNLATIAG